MGQRVRRTRDGVGGGLNRLESYKEPHTGIIGKQSEVSVWRISWVMGSKVLMQPERSFIPQLPGGLHHLTALSLADVVRWPLALVQPSLVSPASFTHQEMVKSSMCLDVVTEKKIVPESKVQHLANVVVELVESLYFKQ